jgi:hypothetical protein
MNKLSYEALDCGKRTLLHNLPEGVVLSYYEAEEIAKVVIEAALAASGTEPTREFAREIVDAVYGCVDADGVLTYAKATDAVLALFAPKPESIEDKADRLGYEPMPQHLHDREIG